MRQGGTALNALDSPAPGLSPPSSTDSWGLCFLHPPGRLRSAPTATRDSPSATAEAPLVHPGEPGPAPPFPQGAEGRWRPQLRTRPRWSEVTCQRVGRKVARVRVRAFGSQSELVTWNKVPAKRRGLLAPPKIEEARGRRIGVLKRRRLS